MTVTSTLPSDRRSGSERCTGQTPATCWVCGYSDPDAEAVFQDLMAHSEEERRQADRRGAERRAAA